MKYTRVTLGTIDDLAHGAELEKIGEGTIKQTWGHNVKIKTPEEAKKLYIKPGDINCANNFLLWVENYMIKNKMYISNATFRHSGSLPDKVTGVFYKEK
jgi:hypothetical protein